MEPVSPDMLTPFCQIRQSLLSEKKRIEEAEERKKQRELKKFGKKVQIAKMQERAKEKKCALFFLLLFRFLVTTSHIAFTRTHMDALKKWRKGRENRLGNEDEEVSFLAVQRSASDLTLPAVPHPARGRGRRWQEAQAAAGWQRREEAEEEPAGQAEERQACAQGLQVRNPFSAALLRSFLEILTRALQGTALAARSGTPRTTRATRPTTLSSISSRTRSCLQP